MKRFLLPLALLLAATQSYAQTPQTVRMCVMTNGVCVPVTAADPLPVDASVSVSGFHQESVLTPFTATTGGATSGSFTAGKVIIVSNAGTTNTAYCQLGGSATTSSQPIPANSSVAFTSSAETTVTCATASSTTTINVSVGTGLPTGWGGGAAGGGGGGAVTIADGADVTEGAIADAAATAGGTGTVSAKLRTATSQLGTIVTQTAGIAQGTTTSGLTGSLILCNTTTTATGGSNGTSNAVNCDTNGRTRTLASIDQTTPGTTNGVQVNAALPAGANIIGKFGIDQTTPGTTNNVAVGTLTGSKAAGTAAASSMLGGGVYNSTAPTLTDGQQAAFQLGTRGALITGISPAGGAVAPASAAISQASSSTLEILALTSAKKIYVTSFNIMAAGTVNVTFKYGTGTNCGTGTTVLTGAYPLTAQAGVAIGSGTGAVLIVPAGNALCLTADAATQVSGSFTYQIF